jgi:hypothetical protein
LRTQPPRSFSCHACNRAFPARGRRYAARPDSTEEHDDANSDAWPFIAPPPRRSCWSRARRWPTTSPTSSAPGRAARRPSTSAPTPTACRTATAPNFGNNVIEFTYVIKEQDGARFAGETEGKFVETIIGSLKPPEYRSGIFLDNDGQYEFTLRDENTIDMCYWHLYPASKVVSCWTITRQP